MATTKKSISFTCPNCAKVLRASARPAAGKKIKCPACSEAFVPEFDDEDEEASAIQEEPRVKAKAKPPKRRTDDDDDPDEKPRSKRSRADDDADDEEDRPRKKHRRDDDDDDEEDDRRSIKKKKKKKSGSSMMLVLGILGIGGLLLSCGLGGVGVWYFWPGPKVELEAFVDPNADMVMGGNPKLIKAKFANLEKLTRDVMVLRGQPIQAGDDVSLHSEKMLAFGSTKNPNAKPVTLYVLSPADIAAVKRNANLGPAQTIGGHANVHKVTEAGKQMGMGTFLAFPGSNIAIQFHQTEQEVIAVLNRGKEKPKPNAALEMGRAVEKSAFWLAIKLDAQARRDMRKEMEAAGGNPFMPLPTLRDAAPAADGINGVTLAVDFDEKQNILLNANALCKDAGDANKFKTGIQDAWTILNGGIQGAVLLNQPGVPPSFAKDMNTMKFSVEGSNATAKMTLTTKTIEDLAKIGVQQMGPGPIAPAPKNLGPPGKRPKGGRG